MDRRGGSKSGHAKREARAKLIKWHSRPAASSGSIGALASGGVMDARSTRAVACSTCRP